MTVNALYGLDLMSTKFGKYTLEETKIEVFLDKVQGTYQEQLQYHNDLHGADVMHMCYYIMKNTDLVKNIKMS